MQSLCPKCGKSYLHWNFLGGEDKEKISGLVIHSYRIVNTPFGQHKVPDGKCFLTLDEFNTFFGDPVVQCEDCGGRWGCDYCKQYNNRPNFVTKDKAIEEEDDYHRAISEDGKTER
jgi:hypothetical protein